MTRALKMLLLWLLMLALPMQGYAAATMLACQTMAAQASERANETMPMHGMHHRMLQADESGMHHHDAMQPGFRSADASHDSACGNHHGHAPCSVCAAYCLGAAVMPAVLDWHMPHAGTDIRPAFLAVLFSGHIPSGIERPPRIILA